MTADPSRLLAMIPDAYHKKSDGDLYKLCVAVMEMLSVVQSGVDDVGDDILYTTSDGSGLVVNGENVSIPRPPGMADARYAILLTTMAPIARGTLDAVRQVFEAATGLSGVIVEDKTTNAAIPDYEIWIFLTMAQMQSYGMGAYAGLTTNYDGWPVESCIAGTVLDALDIYSAESNDHWWAPVDKWTQHLVDSVRLAGTVILYQII